MSARSSVGELGPACKAVGCRQSATAPAVEVLVPASGGLELTLQLCPIHRGEVERAMEAVFQAGLEAVQTAMRAGWGGMVW